MNTYCFLRNFENTICHICSSERCHDPSGKSFIVIDTISFGFAPTYQCLRLLALKGLLCCANLLLHNTPRVFYMQLLNILVVFYSHTRQVVWSFPLHCLWLKECLSTLSLSAMMMTHTPTLPAEIFHHATERKRGSGRGTWFFNASLNAPNTCSYIMLYPLCLFTELVQYSLWFPVGWKCSWCFCTARPLSAFCIYSGNQFLFLYATKGLQTCLYIHLTSSKKTTSRMKHYFNSRGVLSVRKCWILGAKVPTIGCPCDLLTVGYLAVCRLTLCDICSDAVVQLARAAEP